MESLVRGTIGLKRPEKKDWRSDSESGAQIWCNRKGDFATRSTPAGLGHSRDAQSQQSYVSRSRRKANRGCARRDNECANFFLGPGDVGKPFLIASPLPHCNRYPGASRGKPVYTQRLQLSQSLSR